MIVVNAGQPPPPPPPPPPGGAVTAPLSWRWTGPDGNVWELTDFANSPVIKLQGATGIGRGDPEHRWSETPDIDGSDWGGVRIPRGEVFLPLLVTGADSSDFLTQHAAFKRSLDPRREGTLRITRPDTTWWEIDCRYQSGGDLAIDFDPVMAHRAKYGITWATGDPYWHGDAIQVRFPFVTWRALFPGPAFPINPSRSLADTAFTNPGDVEGYGLWHIDGPFTGFTVGFGDRVTRFSASRTAGQWVEIDTTPGVGTVVDDTGADVWLSCSDLDFAPIPAGDVTANVAVPGAGFGSNVSLTFTPRLSEALL